MWAQPYGVILSHHGEVETAGNELHDLVAEVIQAQSRVAGRCAPQKQRRGGDDHDERKGQQASGAMECRLIVIGLRLHVSDQRSIRRRGQPQDEVQPKTLPANCIGSFANCFITLTMSSRYLIHRHDWYYDS